MREEIKITRTCDHLVMMDDITYGKTSFFFGPIPYKDLKLSLIRPLGMGQKRPLFVWICGGGWMTMERNAHMPWLTRIAENGWVVASVDYSMFNAGTMPVQLQNVKAAIRYLRAHADQYGIDADRVVVGGESAGAYLAAMTGVTSGLKTIPAMKYSWNGNKIGLQETPLDVGEYLDESSSVLAVVDFYGPMDLTSDHIPTAMDAPTPVDNLLGYFAALEPEGTAAMCPFAYLSENTPAFFIAHGDKDPVVPVSNSERLSDALDQFGVRNELYVVEGAGHFAPQFYQQEILDLVLEFCKESIKEV